MSDSSLPSPELFEQGGPSPEPFERGGAPASGARGDHAGTALLRSLSPPLLDWLPRQRWFAGKGRPLTGFSLVAATEILPCGAGNAAPGLLHLLVRAHQTARAAVPPPQKQAHSEGDCYQLLLGVRDALPPELAPALVGRPTAGPMRGRAVYEALADPRLTGLLLERLRVPGRLGPLRFSREPEAVIPSGLRPRPLTTEQSNSSVVYGSSCILKLFRRVEPGINPDLELTLALARHGCARVPPPTAWFEAVPPGADDASASMTLGVLQPFVAGACDGWQLALRALAARRDFTGAAGALGRTTALVHTGLAQALPTSLLDTRQLERVADEMAGRLDGASAAVPALRPYRAALRCAYRELAELGGDGRRRAAQRVHGDLHLGQVLGTAPEKTTGTAATATTAATEATEWTLIDFEGEPARPLAERRADQPVVRDIAGMLRSFDYAACQRTASPGDTWSREWAEANRAAYCAGYAEACGSDPREEAVLLRAYETDKAVYEVLYEARNRPAWLGVPMSAIRRLAAPAGLGG
ncbi:maltokinase N-terminal cap-like domain-containing protein [Streptomyces iconiensis]|uniref:Maltokinase n=1 Tax=Streptomyces iconiensis TaxID=1384038 RepID=A0ABT7A0K0_9ACTN|nr:maltokinase [Streptomyces iconiensis]MDJ1134858.1 maltokinase [Streptomyces iconiensis]